MYVVSVNAAFTLFTAVPFARNVACHGFFCHMFLFFFFTIYYVLLSFLVLRLHYVPGGPGSPVCSKCSVPWNFGHIFPCFQDLLIKLQDLLIKLQAHCHVSRPTFPSPTFCPFVRFCRLLGFSTFIALRFATFYSVSLRIVRLSNGLGPQFHQGHVFTTCRYVFLRFSRFYQVITT